MKCFYFLYIYIYIFLYILSDIQPWMRTLQCNSIVHFFLTDWTYDESNVVHSPDWLLFNLMKCEIKFFKLSADWILRIDVAWNIVYYYYNKKNYYDNDNNTNNFILNQISHLVDIYIQITNACIAITTVRANIQM